MEIPDLVRLANAQFGAVSRAQLRGGGASRQQISRWSTSGLIDRLMPGVYVLAGRRPGFATRAMATQLWADGVGFLSSFSAGRIAGLRRMPAEPIHYTAPRSFRRHTPAGVHLDLSSWFDSARDRRLGDGGLIVAEPHRMVFGLAADLRDHAFGRAAEDAWKRGLVDPPSLADYLERHRCRGKDGVARLERWLERAASMRSPAESGFEQEVIAELERAGLSPFVRQHPVLLESGETIRLDVAWPDERFAVEPGSSWFHGGAEAEHRDQLRDLAAARVGWQVLRLNERFRGDLRRTARLVGGALAERRAQRLDRSNRPKLSSFDSHLEPDFDDFG